MVTDSTSIKNLDFEFTLDRMLYSKDDYVIAKVYSYTEGIREFLNPKYNNISIKGNMPKLKESIVYKGNILDVESNQYGYTLKVDAVYPRDFSSDDIKTDNDMINFIEVFIGEGTANKVREVNGICKMIQDKNINELTKIKGIGKKIANKITKVYEADAVGSKFLIKIKKMGFTDNEIKKLSKIYSNLMYAYQYINDNIFNLVFKGFRIDRMDDIFLNELNGDKKDSRRIRAYIFKGLSEYMYNGYKSYIYLDNFYNLEIINNIECNVGRNVLDKCISDLIDDDKLKIVDNKIITTYGEWKLETDLTLRIKEIINNQSPTKLDINDIESDIDEQESIMGFKFNEWQRKAIRTCIETNKSIIMINGYAGTGKTTVTKAILNIYNKYNHGNFLLSALSGRASSILGESSGYKDMSKTIHKTLGINEDGGWYYNYDNKYKDTDILILDEISMIDYFLLKSILDPCTPNMKIILLGDSGQLPSLSFGRTIETMDMFDIELCELTKVMRQSEDSYILKIANDVRMGMNPFENVKYKWYGTDTEVCIGDSYNYMLDSFFKDYKEDSSSSIIITTTKQKSDNINFDIQDLLINEKIINTNDNYIVKPSNISGKMFKIYIGNHIMVLKNNYKCQYYNGKNRDDFYIDEILENEDEPFGTSEDEASVFNGEIYLVKDIFEKYIIVTNGEDDIIVEYDSLECTLAYATNCHKCQGSGFKNVYVYHTNDFVDTNMMVSKQWLYTSYTRSKQKLSIHTNSYTNLVKGIRKDAVDEKVTLIEYYGNEI